MSSEILLIIIKINHYIQYFERVSKSYSASYYIKASFGSTSLTYYRSKLRPSFSLILSFPIKYANINVAALLLPWILWTSIFPYCLAS